MTDTDKFIFGTVLDACFAAGHATTWARGGYRNDVPTLCESCEGVIRTLQTTLVDKTVVDEIKGYSLPTAYVDEAVTPAVTDAEVEAALDAYLDGAAPVDWQPGAMRTALEAARAVHS